MNTTFYVLLILSVIIGSPITFLKNDLLKTLSVTEEIMCVSIGILIIVSMIYFFYEKKTLNDLINITKSDKMVTLLIYIALIVITLLMGNYILKKEGKVIRYKSFQRSLSLILMLVLGHVFYGEKVNTNTCIGVGIIITGLIVLDR